MNKVSLQLGGTVSVIVARQAASRGDDVRQPSHRSYPLRSVPGSSLLLSPLRSPKRPSRGGRINLVSKPSGASTSLSGSMGNVPGDSIEDKLDRLLAQVSTLNTHMALHDQRLARMEKLVLPGADATEGLNGTKLAEGGGRTEKGGTVGNDEDPLQKSDGSPLPLDRRIHNRHRGNGWPSDDNDDNATDDSLDNDWREDRRITKGRQGGGREDFRQDDRRGGRDPAGGAYQRRRDWRPEGRDQRRRDGFYDRDRYEDHNHRPKLKFPSFNGESDPLSWLNKCETYFRGMRTLDDDRVWVASLHLEGATLDWYFGFELDYGMLPWRRFAKYINMQFGPPLRHNSLAELKALYRTGTVEDYQRQFSQLLCRAHDVTPHQQVELFTAGLGEPLWTEVELKRPPNLQTAMSLARAHERRLTHAALPAGRPSSKALPLATTSKLGGAPRPRMNRFSSEELAAKRTNGECYHCTEKYTTDHKCTGKGVFLNEMGDNVDEESMPEELGISLHALTGIDVGNTMKLLVVINGVSLVALVDSGSTHTFIQEGLVDKLGLTVERRTCLSVKVANGDRVPSTGVCRQVVISIDNDTFDISYYTLAMDGFDIVLGVQWLHTLGPILWNFGDLTMAFWHKERVVRWSGISGP
jgi:hypothetical protein